MTAAEFENAALTALRVRIVKPRLGAAGLPCLGDHLTKSGGFYLHFDNGQLYAVRPRDCALVDPHGYVWRHRVERAKEFCEGGRGMKLTLCALVVVAMLTPQAAEAQQTDSLTDFGRFILCNGR